MRLKKGTKVEVLSKKEGPLGSWSCAEIISGNGHTYYVKYYWSLSAAVVERVSRKVIRPCPPPVEGLKEWVPGDIVEVFDNMSWKIATVSKVVDENYYLVKLLGSSQVFKAHKSNLRVRQSWKGNKWVIFGKGAGIFVDGKSNKLSTSRYYQKLSCQVRGTSRKMKQSGGHNIGVQESHVVSSRTLKRKSPCGASHIETSAGVGQKMRVIKKESRCQQTVPGHPSPLLEKVDAECFIARSLEPNDTDSSASYSVGSCSSTSKIYNRFPHHSVTNPGQDSDIHFSDAESFCGGRYEKECSPPTKKDLVKECPPSMKEDLVEEIHLAEDIHKLELHAYRCTMEALYASGPFSWEQEDLMTNLRIRLHISNDERLMELRNLVSSETNLPIC